MITKPRSLPADADSIDLKILDKEIDEYVKRKGFLAENLSALYSLVWGQCTDALRARVEAVDGFAQMSAEARSLDLLREIKSILFNFESQMYLPVALDEAKHRFYTLYQGKHMTTQQFLKEFQNCVDVLRHCGGSTGDDPGMINQLLKEMGVEPEGATADQRTQATEDANERCLAVAFLRRADRARFGKLIETWKMTTFRV